MVIKLNNGKVVRFHHEQDCCEHVYLNDIAGDIQDLVGAPFILAEVATYDPNGDDSDDSQTWTFYKFATWKGYVDVRWIGASNGYYSERVDIEVT